MDIAPAVPRAGALRAAAVVVAAEIALVLAANMGCATFLQRADNRMALAILLSCGVVLALTSLVHGPLTNWAVISAQAAAGVVTGFLTQPSFGILLGVAAGALAIRALPPSFRAALVGVIVFSLGVFFGYSMLQAMSQLTDPTQIRC